MSFDPADVLLLDLPRPDLLLHLPSLLRVPAEQEKTGSESVQTVNGPKVLESVLLGQDEDDGVVTVAAARVNLKIAGFLTKYSWGWGDGIVQRLRRRFSPSCHGFKSDVW